MKNILIILSFYCTMTVAQTAVTGKPVAPAGMVYVPAGSFIMGSNIGDPDEKPEHVAETKAFFMDRYEVSNAEFARFDSTYKFPKGMEERAAIVTWFQANAYAIRARKRLPSEIEWEKAARGTDGRMFPWGNSFDESFVAWDQNESRGGSIAKPESPYGCFDMAGSVWEWTADWYKPYPGNKALMEQYGEVYKVMRGGSHFNNYSFYRTTQRYYLLPDKISRYPVGFRCVMDIK
jgi:formylglycine-generating enzyme required for sulfatase activity